MLRHKGLVVNQGRDLSTKSADVVVFPAIKSQGIKDGHFYATRGELPGDLNLRCDACGCRSKLINNGRRETKNLDVSWKYVSKSRIGRTRRMRYRGETDCAVLFDDNVKKPCATIRMAMFVYIWKGLSVLKSGNGLDLLSPYDK